MFAERSENEKDWVVMGTPLRDSIHAEIPATQDHPETGREQPPPRHEISTSDSPGSPAWSPLAVDAQVHREADTDMDAGADAEDEVFEDSSDQFQSPEPPRYKVRRHINTQKKLTWPPTDIAVEKIVLAFGINSRANKSRETTVKNVQGALRSTRKKFPYTKVWVPLMNFSDNLPDVEKENLRILNQYLEKNVPHIPPLPDHKFQTELDDVHWTADTGRNIFLHWTAFLNSTTP